MNCKLCEASEGHLPKCVAEDLQTVLDCMSGADGGVAFACLRMFLTQCAKEGNDVQPIRQIARLIRFLAPHIDERSRI